MTKIIIINGLGGSGKSTFCNYCSEEVNKFAKKKTIVYELSTVDFVKEVAKFCGWDGAKNTKNRIFLNDLKTILTKWNDIPNKKVFDIIDRKTKEENYCDHIFFINCRESKNIDIISRIAKAKGYWCKTLIVSNPNSKVNEVPDLIEDITSYNYDDEIINNGDLGKLRNLSRSYIKKILEE